MRGLKRASTTLPAGLGALAMLLASAGALIYPTTAEGSLAQQAYAKASNTGGNDFFGDSVAVAGDTMVVGAPEEDSNATGVNGDQSNDSAADSGAVYVFT